MGGTQPVLGAAGAGRYAVCADLAAGVDKKEHHGAHLVCRSSSCGRDHYVDFLKESRGYCHEKSLCEVVICKAI